MDEPGSTPLYNMSVVLKKTGLKADTLRAWERRFGVPNPERTSGGHRQYSGRDIATVHWLLARQQEGMRISRAVQLLNHLQDQGRNPVAEMVAPMQGLQPVLDLGPTNQLDDLRNAWVEACLQFNETNAEQILTQAFALFPAEMACSGVLQAGLAQIGDLWSQGVSRAPQEHYASALALRRVHCLIAATAPPIRNERIIVACPPHETHTFAPLLLTLLLRRRGLPVTYLGADVPTDQLVETVALINARFTLFSAQQLSTAATLLEASRTLAERDKAVAFSGRIFEQHPQIQERIPGHYLGSDLAKATETIESLLRHARPAPVAVPRTPDYERTLRVYTQKRAAITAAVYAETPPGLMPPPLLQTACDHLGTAIAAALSLGDMMLLGGEITWGGATPPNRTGAGSSYPRSFLHLYGKAVGRQLGNEGSIINEWFERLPSYPERPERLTG